MSEIERAFDPGMHSAILKAAEEAYVASPDDDTAFERAVIAAILAYEQHRGKQGPVGYEVNFRTFGEEWVGWHRPGPEFTREHYQKKAKTQPDRYLYRDLYASPQPADVGALRAKVIEECKSVISNAFSLPVASHVVSELNARLDALATSGGGE